MAFGKKKEAVPEFDQDDVCMLASKALEENRKRGVQLPVRVTGVTPLLMHRWTQKAIIQMVGKMTGQNVPRTAKDLTEEYEESHFRNERGEVVMPCRILKAAIISGCIGTGGVVTKAELKRGLRVLGYTAPIVMAGGPKRADHRIASNNGTPDMRSRALIPAGWYFDVVLQFSSPITPDKVVSAFECAGDSIGLCDWRPECGGELGTFTIEILKSDQIAAILEKCSSPEDEYKIPPEFLRAFHNQASKSDAAKKAVAVTEKVNGDVLRTRQRRANGVSRLGHGEAE